MFRSYVVGMKSLIDSNNNPYIKIIKFYTDNENEWDALLNEHFPNNQQIQIIGEKNETCI